MIGASTRIIDSNADGEAIAPVLQKEKIGRPNGSFPGKPQPMHLLPIWYLLLRLGSTPGVKSYWHCQ